MQLKILKKDQQNTINDKLKNVKKNVKKSKQETHPWMTTNSYSNVMLWPNVRVEKVLRVSTVMYLTIVIVVHIVINNITIRGRCQSSVFYFEDRCTAFYVHDEELFTIVWNKSDSLRLFRVN